ncbi:MAG: hypothetical protein ACYCPF_00905 [Streptosporangiaceae bacterium]
MARMNWGKIGRQRRFSHPNVTLPADRYGNDDYDWKRPPSRHHARAYEWQLPTEERARRRRQQLARTGPGRQTGRNRNRKRRIAAATTAALLALPALTALVLLTIPAARTAAAWSARTANTVRRAVRGS